MSDNFTYSLAEEYCPWCDFGLEDLDACLCDANCGAVGCVGVTSLNDDTEDSEIEYLWQQYNAALAPLQKPQASKSAAGLEQAYGIAAERLMRAGQMYKIKAKYRGK